MPLQESACFYIAWRVMFDKISLYIFFRATLVNTRLKIYRSGEIPVTEWSNPKRSRQNGYQTTGLCSREKRLQTISLNNLHGTMATQDTDRLPLVEPQPFTKKIWQPSKSVGEHSSPWERSRTSLSWPAAAERGKSKMYPEIKGLPKLERSSTSVLMDMLPCPKAFYTGREKKQAHPPVKEANGITIRKDRCGEPVHLEGFTPSIERQKSTLAEVRSGSSVVTQFSCRKQAITAKDKKNQQGMYVDGQGVSQKMASVPAAEMRALPHNHHRRKTGSNLNNVVSSAPDTHSRHGHWQKSSTLNSMYDGLKRIRSLPCVRVSRMYLNAREPTFVAADGAGFVERPRFVERSEQSQHPEHKIAYADGFIQNQARESKHRCDIPLSYRATHEALKDESSSNSASNRPSSTLVPNQSPVGLDTSCENLVKVQTQTEGNEPCAAGDSSENNNPEIASRVSVGMAESNNGTGKTLQQCGDNPSGLDLTPRIQESDHLTSTLDRRLSKGGKEYGDKKETNAGGDDQPSSPSFGLGLNMTDIDDAQQNKEHQVSIPSNVTEPNSDQSATNKIFLTTDSSESRNDGDLQQSSRSLSQEMFPIRDVILEQLYPAQGGTANEEQTDTEDDGRVSVLMPRYTLTTT